MKMLKVIICVVLCALQLYCQSNATTSPKPYEIKWPAGWEITELPGPTTSSGKNLGGRRFRALKKESDKAVAVIELTCIPRTDQGKANLEYEFETCLKTVTNKCKDDGFNIKIAPVKKSILGSLPDIETEIQMNGPGFVLNQWIAMAMGKDFVFSIHYSGLRESFDKYHKIFDECLSSLILT